MRLSRLPDNTDESMDSRRKFSHGSVQSMKVKRRIISVGMRKPIEDKFGFKQAMLPTRSMMWKAYFRYFPVQSSSPDDLLNLQLGRDKRRNSKRPDR
jgi:hypothetical protein